LNSVGRAFDDVDPDICELATGNEHGRIGHLAARAVRVGLTVQLGRHWRGAGELHLAFDDRTSDRQGKASIDLGDDRHPRPRAGSGRLP